MQARARRRGVIRHTLSKLAASNAAAYAPDKPSLRDSRNTTPLNAACWEGHIAVVQLLLDNGAVADLNVADDDGDTPKANAEYGGHTAVVDLLSQYTE